MKKRLLVLSVVAICMAITTGGTLAYKSNKGQSHNVITSGNIEVNIDESFGNEEVESTSEDGILLNEYQRKVVPGREMPKEVTVKCADDSQASWVRVELSSAINGDGNDQDFDEYVKLMYNEEESFNSEDWILEDGWYYYKTPVEPGKKTSPLIDAVKFPEELTEEINGTEIGTINIYVRAEAVQAANNPIPEGKDVTDIQGWPNNIG